MDAIDTALVKLHLGDSSHIQLKMTETTEHYEVEHIVRLTEVDLTNVVTPSQALQIVEAIKQAAIAKLMEERDEQAAAG
jgi:hypothetical protein